MQGKKTALHDPSPVLQVLNSHSEFVLYVAKDILFGKCL